MSGPGMNARMMAMDFFLRNQYLFPAIPASEYRFKSNDRVLEMLKEVDEDYTVAPDVREEARAIYRKLRSKYQS